MAKGIARDSSRMPVRSAQNVALGQDGSTFINDTTSHVLAGANDEMWFSVQVIADAVFTSLTDPNRDGDPITGVTFTAGTIFFGTITEIQLASGTVIAYKASDYKLGGGG